MDNGGQGLRSKFLESREVYLGVAQLLGAGDKPPEYLYPHSAMAREIRNSFLELREFGRNRRARLCAVGGLLSSPGADFKKASAAVDRMAAALTDTVPYWAVEFGSGDSAASANADLVAQYLEMKERLTRGREDK